MPISVKGNPINNTDAVTPINHSTLPLEETFTDTHRFGEYHPHLVLEGIAGDNQPWRCIHKARSYTLKAPLMQDIQLHKDYFMVTQRAVLPFQAERVQKNPKIGDDIPKDAYTSVENFLTKVNTFAGTIHSVFADSTKSNAERFICYMKYLIFLECIYSRGSLLASLGCNLTSCMMVSDTVKDIEMDFDDYFDVFCQGVFPLFNGGMNVTIDGVAYIVVPKPTTITFASIPQISFRDFLQKIRDTSDWSFRGDIPDSIFDVILSYTDDSTYSFIFGAGDNMNFPIDLIYCWSYQLACAHYFTDDTVDYIYSADLFRQYIFSLLTPLVSSVSNLRFSWNGQNLAYDYLSAHFFDIFVSFNFSNLSSFDRRLCLQYFLTLFGYRRSLRFRDYFTGSRTRPLAIPSVGADTDVQVTNNKVSVINITRSIQAQRFLNAVNAARSDWEGYVDALFHVRPETDMHNPLHLGHTSDGLFAAETENTGDAVFQDKNPGGLDTRNNSVTAVFRGNSGNFEFSVKCKEQCIIIGVTSYDIKRIYPDIIRRGFFTRDRFDMFLPQMQYIGDQPVYNHELYAGYPGAFGGAFSYQFHDMQFKQMVNRCAGAINSRMLPGYCFLMQRPFLGEGAHISPDFIRARNSELDDFYLSLTSYSLGNYFHFILLQENKCTASRPMTRKPQIL